MRYRVFATARGEAEHVCDCPCCRLARLVEVSAAYEAVIEALGERDALYQAGMGVYAELENKKPRGYSLLRPTVAITRDVRLLDDLAMAGYPRLL